MWRRLAREPLVHFLIAGLVLFGLSEQYRRSTDPYRIVITPARVAQLSSAYAAEFGAPPPPAMLPKLIEDYVAGEVLFREGKARGLDRDDEIVRRRVIQKVEFLEADMASVPEPGEAELRGWFEEHRERYAEPGTISFNHLFFAADFGNEAEVKARALAVLPGLSPDVPPIMELGDSFPDRSAFGNFSSVEAKRIFGDSEMSRKLFSAPVGIWRGPWRSQWGWHLVRVSAAKPSGVADFAGMREQALKDYLSEARAAENARRLAALRARYRVVREW